MRYLYSLLVLFISLVTFSQQQGKCLMNEKSTCQKNFSNVYISDGVIVSGLDAENISISSAKSNTLNQVFVKNKTLFYINETSIHFIKVINLTEKGNFKGTILAQKVKKLPTSIIAQKKVTNFQFKSSPCNTPFLFLGKNGCLNAVISNIYQYKNSVKDFLLFFTLNNKLFVNFEKSNRFTVQYLEITKSYLLVAQYTSRPPPLVA